MRRLSHYLSRRLGIPAGLAIILAVVLMPKVLALMVMMWYVVGIWLARKMDRHQESEK